MTIDVSVITAACNQGDWVRTTVPLITESLGRVSHEIIVVDDQSDDGCCHDLPSEVLVMRTHRRLGVSQSRRLGYSQSTGDILIYTDPHCEYPENALHRLARAAAKGKPAIYQGCICHTPAADRVYAGGKFRRTNRGLTSQGTTRIADTPTLYGTVYAMTREVHDRLDGWPSLPGVWGYSEQALSLHAWFRGVPIVVIDDITCCHYLYQKDRQFPFHVSREDMASNAYWVHAAFFPERFANEWESVLGAHFPDYAPEVLLMSKEFLKFRDLVKKHATRPETDFFESVLGTPLDLSTEDGLIKHQARKVKPKKKTVAAPRIKAALRWMVGEIPGCIKGRKVLDVGSRDGIGIEVIEQFGAAKVEGVELIPEVADFANKRVNSTVRQGDMRALSDQTDSWDIVTCLHTIEHVPNPVIALAELVRVVKHGGWIFLAVPLEKKLKDASHNTHWPTAKSFVEFVTSDPDIDTHSVRYNEIFRKGRAPECRVLARKQTSRTAAAIHASAKPITDLHVAIITSPSPDNPDTDNIEKTIDSAFTVLCQRVPVFIYCDQSPVWARPEEDAAYQGFLTRLESKRFGSMIVADEHIGFLGQFRKLLDVCKDPMVFNMQHDWVFVEPSRIDVTGILRSLSWDRRVRYIRFAVRTISPNSVARNVSDWEPLPNAYELPIVAMAGWAAPPHFATLEHYYRRVVPCLAEAPGEDGVWGVEGLTAQAYRKDRKQNGFKASHRRWGTWTYGQMGDSRYLKHTGNHIRRWREDRVAQWQAAKESA